MTLALAGSTPPPLAGGSDRPVHLCLVQPAGYPHSGALLDPLVFFQEQFERAGARVTASTNSLVTGAVNYVFGAHLGFARSLLDQHRCVLVNLEQLGPGGAQLPPAYLDLLRGADVVDYHPDNLASYAGGSGSASLVRLGPVAHLGSEAPPLDERDIDLLFIGSLTPRRLELLQRVERCGQEVTVLQRPLYGPARDALVRRARAVLNVSAYEASRFEQVRASFVLSCGTPLVSEQRSWTAATDRRFLPLVHWFDPSRPDDFFRGVFRTARFVEDSRTMLERWRSEEVHEDFTRLLAAAPAEPAR